jgi:hypothetical protein
MAVFLTLVIPLPHVIKRKLFAFISESPIIAKMQYGLKVCVENPQAQTRDNLLIKPEDYIYLHSYLVP